MSPRSKKRQNRSVETSTDKCGYDGDKPVLRDAKDFAWARGKRELAGATFNLKCDRIEWLFSRGQIEPRQYDAAKRLMMDAEQAAPRGRSCIAIGNGGGHGDTFPADVQIDADRRRAAAQKALGHNWPIVELVVIRNISVAKAAGVMHADWRVCMGMLLSSLHILADHYRMA